MIMITEDIVKKVNNNELKFINKNDSSFLNAICYYSDELIIKELNNDKIMFLYNGKYSDLSNEYYSIISEIIPTIKKYECIILNNKIYEICTRLNDKYFFENSNEFSWHEFINAYQKIIEYVNNIKKFNNLSDIQLGLEAAIWNFNINGINFDFSPPRIITKENKNIFTRSDEDHYKRTYYRCFDYDGMRINLAVTAIKVIKDNKVNIKDLPKNWKQQLIKILEYNLNDHNLNCLFSKYDKYEFSKHPLKILKEQIKYE